MISKKDIHNLTQLARIEMSDAEEEGLLKDVENILEFVGQIQDSDAEVKKGQNLGVVKNVMREDGPEHRSGEFTEAILDEAPDKKDGYFKVKKII